MRFIVGFILVFVFVQSVPVVRQANPIDSLQGLDDFFDDFLAEMAAILTPEEFESFQKDLYQLMLSATDGEIDSEEFQLKFEILLEQYLAPYSQSRFDFQNLGEQFVDAAIEVLPSLIENVLDKREATDALQFNAILAAAPQLSVLINPLKEVLAQLATSLPPAQLQSLQEQILQLILSAAAGKIDVNQLKDQLEALLQPYLTSNRNFDQLIQQVVSTDTAGLPNVIINFLSKRDVNID